MSRRASAIDIGSNAIRMMVAEINGANATMHVLKRYRAAVRLGHDVFTHGFITPPTMELASATFKEYANINKTFGVSQCRAVATSACREAKNNKEFIENIFEASGIRIEIIDGKVEGEMIHQAVRKELELNNKKTMLIDIGGGSVEISFSQGETLLATQSFPLGTVRLLENLTQRNLTEEHINILMGECVAIISDYVLENTKHKDIDFAIGTGGNLECLGKLKGLLLQRNPQSFLTLSEVSIIIERLRALKIKDRIERLKLRPDRADVIVPASILVQILMRQAECEKIMIPSVGLRDGIIWSMI